MKTLFQRISRFFPQRIWQQIFLILVFLIVIPLMFLGFLLIRTSQDAIKTSVLRDHKEIVVRAAGQVQEFLRGPRKALRVTASVLGTLHSDAWQEETVLVEMALQYPIFRRVASVDLKGRETAVSSLGTPLLDRSGDTAFLKAVSGEEYISEVYISEDYIPMMMWALPVRELGKVRGVLIADVNLRGVWDIVDSISIGETGGAYIVDNQWHIISHPDKKFILKEEKPFYQDVVGKVFQGEVGSREEHDEQGKGWIVSFAPIKEMNWGMISFQSQTEAYAFLSTMKTESWILIFVTVLTAIFISIGFSRLMSRPIGRLIEGTRRVAKGDLEHPLAINRRDEMGRLLHAFNDMTQKLKKARHMEKLSAIGEAATAIAHELKNSLILVNTYVQLLPERHKDKKFIKEMSDVVPTELNTWKRMLQEMMDYSRLYRLDAFPKKPVDINAIVEELAVSVKETARQNRVRFEVTTAKQLPLISGNSDKLKQAFLNIITNALDSVSGERSITLATRLVDKPGKQPFVNVEIRDTGAGIPPERLSKIFEPFYTTKSNGLGLGLAICKEIVEHHGGRIEVFNDQGATFSVCLPVMNGKGPQGEKGQ
jgi:signal transduction histidine kinase